MVALLQPEYAQWKPVLTKGIEKCANDANNDTYLSLDEDDSSSEEDTTRVKCSKRSGYFLACVGGQLYQNCPSDVWTNTTRCEINKAIVQKCNVFLPPPPHRHHHHGKHHHHHHDCPWRNDGNETTTNETV